VSDRLISLTTVHIVVTFAGVVAIVSYRRVCELVSPYVESALRASGFLSRHQIGSGKAGS
jgi:hypothetical protein